MSLHDLLVYYENSHLQIQVIYRVMNASVSRYTICGVCVCQFVCVYHQLSCCISVTWPQEQQQQQQQQ